MRIFKSLSLSFWQKNQGFGMIETALILPLFLLIVFGVIEFGNMFLQRYQVRDVSDAVAEYLGANPAASDSDLKTFVANLGFGTLKNTGLNQTNDVYGKLKIQAQKTMKTGSEFNTLCQSEDKKWVNPWLSDDDATNDKNPYYIHICYPYTYQNITPLSNFLSEGAINEIKIISGKSMAYISENKMNLACPEGQMLTAITNGDPVCKAPCPGKAFVGIGTPGADSDGCASVVIGPFKITSVTVSEIAENCIDRGSTNQTVAYNMPYPAQNGATDAYAGIMYARFMNTCGNRYCIRGPKLQGQQYTFGRVIEHSGEFAVLQCFK